MIRIVQAAVATSVQDEGRYGHRAEGYARSGAMDHRSLVSANRLAGASDDAAGIEFGPGPLVFECIDRVAVAFGGASRSGAPWWRRVRLAPGERVALSAPADGTWSYLSMEGGVRAPSVLGSMSTNVREGIGDWIVKGDSIPAGDDLARRVASVDPPPMQGPMRIFGRLPGEWIVGSRRDRMGYELSGSRLEPGPADDWSEPVLPGCIQVLPSGLPIVLMPEGSTLGGYRVVAVVHSDDLRLVAQAQPGQPIAFEQSD